MPLPSDAKQAWPPRELQPVYDKIAIWSAWYSGDPDALSAVYGGTTGANIPFFGNDSGTGLRGRARAAIQRFFWGKQTTVTEQRTKLHIPMAGDIASASADLLFSEPPKLVVDEANEATQAVLDLMVDDGFHSTLLESAEIASALSGVYLRVCWDKSISDTPIIDSVHPDAAVPEWSYGKLTAVTFWRTLTAYSSQGVVRHLERHEMVGGRSYVSHAVYVGTSEAIGQAHPLQEFAETAALAALYANENGIDTGSTTLTAVYIPNVRPNRLWRNLPAAASLGRSDYAGVEPLMDALDETYSSWMRDIDQGKGRLIVPQAYLMSAGRGKGATFDTEQSVYTGLETLPSQGGGLNIEQVQFQIRVTEHRDTANNLTEQIVSRAGYSAQTFGLAGDTAATATEVAARERRSLMLRDRKIRYFSPGLADIVQAWQEVYVAQFGADITPERPDVVFGDAVSVDPESTARTLQLLDAAKAVSTPTKVRILHPDWDDPEVDAEVALIDGGAVEDPGTFTGAPPAEPPIDPNAPPAPAPEVYPEGQ